MGDQFGESSIDLGGPVDQSEEWPALLQPGGAFLFDGPDEVEPIWGRGDEVLWAEGEALIIAGPPGVGKTTLAGQVVRARLGLDAQVLGYPVRPTGSKVLYLAMDRPSQIRRSLLRQLRPEDRATADERLVVWKGPPPFDLAKFPSLLLDLARKAGADTVIVDSLKDAFLGLNDDEAAAGYNRARQTALVHGVEVQELHHQRKSGANSAAPTTLADLYGSTWIAAGAGSVILLWGAPGDLIVQLRHLKQPMAEVGPFQILHDHDGGTSSIHRGADLVRLATIAGVDGITVKAAACAMFDTDKPTDSQIEKARRKLHGLARPGGALVEQGGGRTGSPATYRAAIRVLESEVTGVTEGVTHPSGSDRVTTPTEGSRLTANPQVTGVTDGVTGVTVPRGHASPLLTSRGRRP
jgi:replicative DNA helicase